MRSHTGLLAFWDSFFEKNPFKSVDHVLSWVVWIFLLLLTDLEAFLVYLGIVLCWIFVNIWLQLVSSLFSLLGEELFFTISVFCVLFRKSLPTPNTWSQCSKASLAALWFNLLHCGTYSWIVFVYSVRGGWLFVSYLYSIINHNLLKKSFPTARKWRLCHKSRDLIYLVYLWILMFLTLWPVSLSHTESKLIETNNLIRTKTPLTC